MIYDFNKFVSRVGTHSIKWEHMPEVEGVEKDKLLPLWIADMDFPCANPIIEAMHKRIDRQIFGYSSANEFNYLQSIRGWFSKRFDWTIDTEDIKHSPGIVPALAILIKALTKPGDGVIVNQPIYYPFMSVIKNNDRVLLNNELLEKDGEYFLDFEDLEEKASKPETKMMFFCSPHNPIGRVWTEEELNKIITICLKHNVYVISDEIHCDIVRKGVRHIPMAKLNSDERIITCTAASKSFNLAGMQTSSIIIRSPKLQKKWLMEMQTRCSLFGANPIALVATQAAYNHGESWLEQVNDYIDKNLEFTAEFLKNNIPKAKFILPEATYFAWIDFRAYGFTSKELEDKVLKEGGVLLDEGYIFGALGEGFERINVACPRSILEQCLIRIKEVLIGK
ncbi:MAG: pyridoxal phosphate-dependent aminotransferase [Spirochaetaceae bacterium]